MAISVLDDESMTERSQAERSLGFEGRLSASEGMASGSGAEAVPSIRCCWAPGRQDEILMKRWPRGSGRWLERPSDVPCRLFTKKCN